MSLINKIIACLLFIVSYNTILAQNNNYDSTISDIEYIKSKEYKCYNKGHKAASKGKYRRAIKFFSCAIKESHKKHSPLALRVSYYKERGKSYSYLWKRKKAIKDYLMCLSLDSTNDNIISLLIREYRFVQDFESALFYYNKLSKTKNDFSNLIAAINIYNGLKKYHLAISSSKVFLDKYNDTLVNSSHMANTYFEIFDYKNATLHFERLKDSNSFYFDDYEYRVEINKKLAISYIRLAVEDYKINNDTSQFIKNLYQATQNHEPSFLDDEELRQLAGLLFSMKKWDYSYYYYYYIKKHTLSDYRDLCNIGTKTIIEKDKLIRRSCKKIRKWRKQFRYE